MSLYNRVHYINFARKLTVNAALFLLPLRFVDSGFNGWQIGMILSCYAAAPLLFSIPTGWINDRFSMAGVIRAALAAQGLLFAAMAFLSGFAAAAAVFFLMGTVNIALDVSINSLYYKDEAAVDQHRKYGRFVFWLAAGPSVGVAGGGLLLQLSGFRLLLLAFGVLILSALIAVRGLGGAAFHVVSIREYGRDFFRRKSLLFVVFNFLLALHWAVEGSVYGPYLRQAYGLSNLQASLYMGTGLLMMAVGALAAGRLRLDARAASRCLLAGMAVSGAGLILMIASDVWTSLAFRLLHDFGDGVIGVFLTLVISRLFDKRSIGGSAAALVTVQITAQLVGAQIFAPLGFSRGLQYPFYIAGAILLANAAYGVFVFRRADY